MQLAAKIGHTIQSGENLTQKGDNWRSEDNKHPSRLR